MTVLWRRYRTTVREGPRTILDLEATIRRQCKSGVLDAPVLVSDRRNRAKLVVAIDASSSMVSWKPFVTDLVESLGESRLGLYSVYYFDNVPTYLSRTSTGSSSIPISLALEESAGSAALVVSDAGAARGGYSPARYQMTEEFLRLTRTSWKIVAWLNPMPRRRWINTTAELIARRRGLRSFPLGLDGFSRAVDVLRGQRT
jgi:uncharacterized protein